MNDAERDILVETDLDDDLPVTPPEMKLIGELLPQLIKEILALQTCEEE